VAELPVLVDLDPASLDTLPCCGVKNAKHEGRRLKCGWLGQQLPKGLRVKLLVAAGAQCGYIEYLPGEAAWRGVDAAGWMFIHCIWTYRRRYQRQGQGARMLEACLEDARRAGMNGVAVLTRDGPWMAGDALFLANGFEVAATAPPDYRLLVRRLEPNAPLPRFRDAPPLPRRLAKGLVIVRSDQCPHIARLAGEIAEAAAREFGLAPRIVELRSAADAQQAPTPYAVFSILLDGRVIADHPISRTRFRNLMRKLAPPGAYAHRVTLEESVPSRNLDRPRQRRNR
jgi:GNAT superfamily N-acetyltransferase